MNRSIHHWLSNVLFPTPNGVARLPNQTLESVGLFGLLLCLLGLLEGKSLASVGMALLLIATLGGGRTLWPIIKNDPLSKLIGLTILYFTIRTVFAVFEFPEIAKREIAEGTKMLRISLIPLFAYWIGGELKAVLHSYALVLAGMLLTLLFRFDWLHLSALLSGDHPVSLNVHHSNVGLVFSTAFIGLVIFSKIFLKSTGRVSRGMRIGLFLSLAALLLQVTLIAQARMIWVGIFLWVLCVLFYLALKSVQSPIKNNLVRQGILFGSLILVVFGLVFSQFKIISVRFSQEQVVIKKVFSGDLTDIPVTSFGTRLYYLQVGLDAVKERFFFGWGPGTIPYLLQKSNIPERLKTEHVHLHNTYLELFVRMGLVGFLLVGSVFLYILRASWHLARGCPIKTQIALFSLSAFFILGVASLADNYFRQIGWFFMAMIGGCVESFSLWSKEKTEAQEECATIDPKSKELS